MILVTGGAGFIGSNIVAALAADGRDVVVSDRLRSGDKWRNLAKSRCREIVQPEALADWLETEGDGLDAIVHMGAISSTTERDADLVYEVNVRLSWSLWRWCAAHGRPFVYASSAATYGDGKAGFDDDASPAAMSRLRPLNAYGWSKLVFDRRVAECVAAGSAAPPQWAGLRFFNVYGPNEYHKGSMQSVIAQRYPAAAAGEPVVLFESHDPRYEHGGQLRDFVYVDDCVEVVRWLLAPRAPSGIFNVGSGHARSFADLARALCVATGHEPRITYVPMPEAIRPNYQYFTEARLDRLRSAGYTRATVPLEDGVREYVQRFLSQRDRYR
jgi:ADP-L-glycero-D-manno-heptose 6-epimerase